MRKTYSEKLNLVIIYFVYGYVSTYPYNNIKIESPIQVRMIKIVFAYTQNKSTTTTTYII